VNFHVIEKWHSRIDPNLLRILEGVHFKQESMGSILVTRLKLDVVTLYDILQLALFKFGHERIHILHTYMRFFLLTFDNLLYLYFYVKRDSCYEYQISKF